MIYTKENPTGLDREIQRMQNFLDGCLTGDVDIYGKIYINEKDGVKLAEAYKGNGEYAEIFVDDRKAVVMGFLVGEKRSGVNMVKVPVELIVSCNLEKLYNTKERKEEEVIASVIHIVRRYVGFKMQTDIKTGLKNVFAKFSPERFKHRDMQPFFNFSVGFYLSYKYN